jgi:hypothetical protein
MNSKIKILIATILPITFILILITCSQPKEIQEECIIKELKALGLDPEEISAESFYLGIAPKDFKNLSGGAEYKPSYNEDPAIPPQCWIETGYGTQNACKYCHTDYLANIRHGNALKIAEDQVLYSFPSPNLNKVLWRNIIFPHEIIERLKAEGIALPNIDDIDYVRKDNWTPAYQKARQNGNSGWINNENSDKKWILFPSLNPNHLFPFIAENPTGNGKHGYVDLDGFVKNEKNQYTGWRAINFFPYAIFTPLTGSVSGIYIRLPENFMQTSGKTDIEIYKANLELLEKNIKNQEYTETHYLGDASDVKINKGFYPVGTEFAHPLHYVDLMAQGQIRRQLDGIIDENYIDYEFPGTRSKRVKEIRYMYKWKDVSIEDLDEDEGDEEEEFDIFIGREGQGWIDNEGGWIIAAYIEDRNGNLRPQTTEELAQCFGCHGNVGNTVDAVWSFQRKLPGNQGWGEMDYGKYDAATPFNTRLKDYMNEKMNMGEYGYFLYSVVGADLYGVMPEEIKDELINYIAKNNIATKIPIEIIFDDNRLKNQKKTERYAVLKERQRIMRMYAESGAYLNYDEREDKYFIKGNIFYPSINTMKNNIKLYRQIVLDQSFNLGKDVFGSESENVSFTFRSDGEVRNEKGKIIPISNIITSRPYKDDGVGYTPTGIVAVNKDGEPIDINGNVVDIVENPEKVVGHISTGGTFDMEYNPILSNRTFRMKNKDY